MGNINILNDFIYSFQERAIPTHQLRWQQALRRHLRGRPDSTEEADIVPCNTVMAIPIANGRL
jgi:hypothetical protein